MKKKSTFFRGIKTWRKPILIMKLTISLILLCVMQSFAGIRGQSITLSLKETEISKVLTTIERQGNYRFLFNSRLKDLKQKISVSFQQEELGDALNEIFGGTNLTYKRISGDLIAIRSSDPAEQDIKITGRVIGDGGEPLSSVSVFIKGTARGTTTDNTGSFTIVVPDNATLVISAIGYETQEVKVGNQTVLSINMKLVSRKIDEVVVIGYGTATKRDLTGSIAKVAGKDIADKPNTNRLHRCRAK